MLKYESNVTSSLSWTPHLKQYKAPDSHEAFSSAGQQVGCHLMSGTHWFLRKYSLLESIIVSKMEGLKFCHYLLTSNYLLYTHLYAWHISFRVKVGTICLIMDIRKFRLTPEWLSELFKWQKDVLSNSEIWYLSLCLFAQAIWGGNTFHYCMTRKSVLGLSLPLSSWVTLGLIT